MRFLPLLLLCLLARTGATQEPDTTRRGISATVTGIVRDSIARRPLAGAMVQMVDADSAARFGRTTISDSLGRFSIADVPKGRYMLGFFHPVLDSLGVAPPLSEVYVLDASPVRADLSVPSPARLRTAVCGPTAMSDTAAVVIGVVRGAQDGTPAAGVVVTGEWLEVSFRSDGLFRRVPRLVATTGENGWFALCNVPRGGSMALMASRGADSTDIIEVEVPADGFLRRDLYLGPMRTMAAGDSVRRTDTLSLPPLRLRSGDGRLRGTVVAAEGGRPVSGAQVRIADGPQTLTNERGEWTLANAPEGTRRLEVRSVGYYPEIRPVDVIDGASPVRVTLTTLKAVLDTVRVTASRLRMHGTGFEERRRSGMGRYLTPADVERWRPFNISDMFVTVPGMRVYRTGLTTTVLVRGSAEGWCSPAVYLNGALMFGLTVDDMDGWVNPKEITGIEIYTGGIVPPQYQAGMTSCGSIVYWTR